jgi:hypothetical protein
MARKGLLAFLILITKQKVCSIARGDHSFCDPDRPQTVDATNVFFWARARTHTREKSNLQMINLYIPATTN